MSPQSIQTMLLGLGTFLNGFIFPLLFAAALLFFVVNAARYFIIGGADEKKRAQARIFALYGIAAFVLLVSLWGIVNMLVGSLGIDNDEALCPDYLIETGGCGVRLPNQAPIPSLDPWYEGESPF